MGINQKCNLVWIGGNTKWVEISDNVDADQSLNIMGYIVDPDQDLGTVEPYIYICKANCGDSESHILVFCMSRALKYAKIKLKV